MDFPEHFCGHGNTGQADSLGLAAWNNFCRLWAVGVASSCLAPGPGMMKAEDYCLLGWKDPGEGVCLWLG